MKQLHENKTFQIVYIYIFILHFYSFYSLFYSLFIVYIFILQ